ncbi:hypothetical protein DL96DRAFT_494160 [Flagelloscypha sp. PMI_526]|nr:hypothetical protein DL96DRAFT_494160 [Flagelloscypha sp. PMI_526]
MTVYFVNYYSLTFLASQEDSKDTTAIENPSIESNPAQANDSTFPTISARAADETPASPPQPKSTTSSPSLPPLEPSKSRLLVGPKRAGPPRKKKSAANLKAEPETETVPEVPSGGVGVASTEDEAATAAKQEVHQEAAVGQGKDVDAVVPSLGASTKDDGDGVIEKDDEKTESDPSSVPIQEPSSASTSHLEEKETETKISPSLNDNSKEDGERAEPTPEITDVSSTPSSKPVPLERDSTFSSTLGTPATETDEPNPVPIPEPTSEPIPPVPSTISPPNDEEDDEEVARKARLREKMAKMGGFNPFAGPAAVISPPRSAPTSPPEETDEAVGEKEREEEDEETRRQRMREKMAKMGGFNPFAGGAVVSPPAEEVREEVATEQTAGGESVGKGELDVTEDVETGITKTSEVVDAQPGEEEAGKDTKKMDDEIVGIKDD